GRAPDEGVERWRTHHAAILHGTEGVSPLRSSGGSAVEALQAGQAPGEVVLAPVGGEVAMPPADGGPGEPERLDEGDVAVGGEDPIGRQGLADGLDVAAA